MNRYLFECSEKLCFLSLRSLFRVCYEIASAKKLDKVGMLCRIMQAGAI